MSILINTDDVAALTVTDFFATDEAAPFTICAFLKTAGSNLGSFYEQSIVKLSNQSGDVVHELQHYRDGDNATGFGINVGYSGGDFSIRENINPNFKGNWVGSVAVFSTSTLLLFSKNTLGTISQTGRSNRNDGGFRNLLFFDDAWGFGDVFFAKLAVYKAELTEVQATEYLNSGAVAGLTPYAQWDATSDWGSGDITDSGSSGTDITPLSTWNYSSDNPTFAASGPDYTARKGSTATITHTLTADGITTATLNGETVTIGTQSGQDADIDLDETAITTSGEYDLVLGDGTDTETFTVQYNVIGLATNTLQKEGDALADLSDVRITVLNAAGTRLDRQTGLTTNATGVTGTTIVAAGDPDDAVEVSYYSASAEAGITFVTALELL